MVFSRQEDWSGLPFPFLGDLPNPGLKPTSPALAGRFFTTEPPGKFPSKVFKHDLIWLNLHCFNIFLKCAQLCPTLCDPRTIARQAPLSMGILQARVLQWIAFPSPGDPPNPGIKPRSPALLADSLPAEPRGKPKNTGVGSLSLLQGIFPTQESNQGLLHCRWILYQLPGKPFLKTGTSKVFKIFFMILLKSKKIF